MSQRDFDRVREDRQEAAEEVLQAFKNLQDAADQAFVNQEEDL